MSYQLHVGEFDSLQNLFQKVLDARASRREIAVSLPINLIANYLINCSSRSNGVNHLLCDSLFVRLKVLLENIDVARAVVGLAGLVGFECILNLLCDYVGIYKAQKICIEE